MASEDLPANGHGGPADPAAAKRDLRRGYRARRDAFVASIGTPERDVLEAALGRLLDRHVPAGIVATYAAVGSEIGVGGLGRPIVLPRVTRGQPLTFHAASGDLVAGAFGAIPEPPPTAPVVEPDIVLVPLLAVDPAGNRLGQGGGHYDRTLARLRARRAIVAVGIAWDMQVVDALVPDAWDQPLDAVATPRRWLACRRT